MHKRQQPNGRAPVHQPLPKTATPAAGPPAVQGALALRREVGNQATARLLGGARSHQPPAVQRLRAQGGAVLPLKDQSDTFLLDLVGAIAVSPRPATYTNGGVTYDVHANDLDRAKKLLSERQIDLARAGRKKSPYENYDAYAAKSKEWKEKRESRETAALATGSYLYHGTTKEVGLIVQSGRLTPAQPSFRKGVWDASRDGFLSMATTLKGVTVTANSVILRMKVQEGDLDTWQWKPVGGNDEVVSTKGIPSDRLEWSTDRKEWKPMGDLS
ncbi:hypothetical protein AB0I52_02340 [Streptomyces sp. NPDC050423]|uniref:hypothetical protein n=1 Tax=Streptomyces sp. NPDC050423 TaxID=3155402 RepID=UPI00343D5ACC